MTFGANTAMMIAVSLMYRYADFVRGIGGDELQLGLIVGAGMVGSLLVRSTQGVSIDVYGARWIWICSAAIVMTCSLGHLAIHHAYGVPILLLRIAMQTGVAGFFGATISYVSSRTSISRVVEVVATLGSSGFIGTIVGSVLGDIFLQGDAKHERMFVLAAMAAFISVVFGWFASDAPRRLGKRRRPPMAWLVRRYHPGPILLMGVVAGFGLSIPTIYLRPFAEDMGIEDISWFFLPYMLIALFARLTMRRLPSLVGVRPIVIIGAVTIAVGMLSFNLVSTGWQMLVPALFMGVAHAIMFPTVVAGGSTAFPSRYRGLGTTFMLAMFDLGNFLAFVSVGAMVVGAKQFGLPGYQTMFAIVAAMLAITSAVYVWMSRTMKPAPQPAAAEA